MMAYLEYLRTRYLDEKGQGMVEYALILAFVVVIAGYLTGNNSIGNAISSTFAKVASTLGGSST